VKKISNSLVTLSSAAILAVYAAGYERTAPAAERFAAQIAQRRTPPVLETKAALPVAIKAQAVAASIPVVTAAVSPTPAAAKKSAAAPAEAKPAKAAAPAPETALPAQPEPVAPVESAAAAETEPVADPAPAPAAADVVYKDGVYLGWGYSRHGNIQAFVRIEGGKIIRAGVEKCQTRWSCDLVAHLHKQVIDRQSAEVDYVSGATQSGDAFYGAIFQALSQAK
jgi:uncharacterized protein with FMN-binding domain